MVQSRVLGAFSGKETREQLYRDAFVDSARRVASDLGTLKGAAMKLGQGLALAADSLELPEDVRAQLSRLHDSAEPVPFDQIRDTVEAELGGPTSAHYSRLDPEPLGTASLARPTQRPSQTAPRWSSRSSTQGCARASGSIWR